MYSAICHISIRMYYMLLNYYLLFHYGSFCDISFNNSERAKGLIKNRTFDISLFNKGYIHEANGVAYGVDS